MTTSRERAGRAFAMGAAETRGRPAADPESRGAGGNWSRQAIRGLESELAAARDDAARAAELQYRGILEGSIPLSIPAEAIEDAAGTDRIATSAVEAGAGPGEEGAPADDGDGESFASLRANIRQRGLRTPLRVRPVDPDWRPAPENPRDIAGVRFALQSGRRRLAACRELGIEPMAFVAFAGAEAAYLDDIHERFFENALRKDLTIGEKLYSIGLIARETRDATQAQIAEIIGVSVPNVSRGLAVVEHYAALACRIDLAAATRNEIDRALKALREERLSESPDARRMRARRAADGQPAALPFRESRIGIGTLRLRADGKGRRILSLESDDLDDARLQRIVELLKTVPGAQDAD